VRYIHPSQIVAARTIAGFFGANFAGLGDPNTEGSSQLTTTQDSQEAATPQTPQEASTPAPLDADRIRRIKARERERTLDKVATTLVWSSLGASLVRGAFVGALSASGWQPIVRGALGDASLAAVGSGLGLYILGRRGFGGWLLLAGVLGGAAVVAWRVRRGA